jgi:hypothetical protein
MPGPCQMRGSHADADTRNGMGASELCGGGVQPGRALSSSEHCPAAAPQNIPQYNPKFVCGVHLRSCWLQAKGELVILGAIPVAGLLQQRSVPVSTGTPNLATLFSC